MPASHPMHTPEQASRFTALPLQWSARAIGWLLLLIGLVGSVLGVATNNAGASAGSTSVNLIHLTLGIAGVVMARTLGGARLFLVVGGVACLALSGYGLVVDGGNGVDDWLRLGLAVTMIGLVAALGRGRGRALPSVRTGAEPRRQPRHP